jgi:arylsulfatase A
MLVSGSLRLPPAPQRGTTESKKTQMVNSRPISRRRFMGRTLKLGAASFGPTYLSMASGWRGPSAAEVERTLSKPNFILILCDNLGYGDIGCFGSEQHRTPHIDRMAEEGMRFTDFYATSGVCTPSRASLMTGCYPRRVNMHIAEDGRPVLSPVAKKGLHPEEVTIAEVLKDRGYATACIGKWHLGDQLPFLPTRQGFDYYLGIPYSDDMTLRPGRDWPPLPLMENEKVIEAPTDRNLLTKRYTEAAVKFIKANKDKPFFIYLPHAMPGSTKAPFAGKRFRGKSANGPWGDSVEELDWSTGEILHALKELDLDERTLVIWTSDNGAPRRDPPQGLNAPLAGWGYTCSEGGQRVPCIMRWPGRIPAGTTCSELCTTMDLLPTFARLAGTQPPKDRIIDGQDIWPLMAGKAGAASPYEAFYYYYMGQLQAVRSGTWKLHLPLKAKWRNFRGDTKLCPAELYDLEADIGETTNLAETHPDVVTRLLALAEKAREDMGDVVRPGSNQRPAGMADDPTPRALAR